MMKKIDYWLHKEIWTNQRLFLLFTVTVMMIYLFPLYSLGENVRLQVYDNLDITIPNIKVLVDSGMLFASSDAIVPNVMGGLPRLCYGSELNGYVWLHALFDPFTAFVINETLIHIVAFFSMYLLLSRYFVPGRHRYRHLIIYAVSLMFSLLPFYTGAGLSGPTLPLALYVFLNIRNSRSTWKDWAALAAIPFYSSLTLFYFFFLLVMTAMFVIDTWKNRAPNHRFFLALAVMSVSFVVVEYRMIYDMFFGPLFVSHRVEFSALQAKSLWETYKAMHGVFLNGSVDMDTRASAVVLPFMLLAMALSFVPRRLPWYVSLLMIISFIALLLHPEVMQHVTGNKYAMPVLALAVTTALLLKKRYRLFYALVALQIFFAVWYAFWFYEGTGALAIHIPILKEFNFARIALLQPLWWSLITVYAMVIVMRKIRFAPLLIAGVVVMQVYVSLNVREFSAAKTPLSYRSYFAEGLFSQIKAHIGQEPSAYRVGSLSFDPAIAIYNGMYTVDGYMPNYPLEYKHRFSNVIQKPLSDNAEIRDLFAGWGSKCYLYDPHHSFLHYRKESKIEKLELDIAAFYALGGRYLLSGNEIELSQTKYLVFEKKFTDSATFWEIYLYRVDLSKKHPG